MVSARTDCTSVCHVFAGQLATVLVYLSTVEEGGETIFPLEGKDGLQRLVGINYKSCEHGFKVSSFPFSELMD